MVFEFAVLLLLIGVPLLTAAIIFGLPKLKKSKEQDDARHPAQRSKYFRYKNPKYRR